ncbi:hypothetical protein Goshw_019980 [Gossypium schwendimanii]|uniref:Uncharacterized protein n=1 Tax=Gossypium schwendimanii TaxID=34291 RepID=A0A7J9MYK5_GOSSC|nr:hypothetical protein [Gossypium schwendimanii]
MYVLILVTQSHITAWYVFDGLEEFKTALAKYAVNKRFDIVYLRNEKQNSRARQWDYANVVRKTNSDDNVKVMVERPTPTEVPKFKRFYVGFSALRKGFRECCRPFIFLDECFLKGRFKGELFSVFGRDDYDQTYPISRATV